jgi:hypothetical protein
MKNVEDTGKKTRSKTRHTMFTRDRFGVGSSSVRAPSRWHDRSTCDTVVANRGMWELLGGGKKIFADFCHKKKGAWQTFFFVLDRIMYGTDEFCPSVKTHAAHSSGMAQHAKVQRTRGVCHRSRLLLR